MKADIGERMWKRWLEASLKAGEPLRYVAVGNQGEKLEVRRLTETVHFILERSGVGDAYIFVTRALGRVQPTILGQRGGSEPEKWQSATGREWTSARKGACP